MNRVIIRDLLLILLMVFVMLIVLLMQQMQSVTQVDAEVRSPGQLAVTIVWPNGDTDVDLQLLAPGERNTINYERPNGKVWSLLRDDLGTTNDVTDANFENAYTRGLPAGLYVINVMCYRCTSQPFPFDVKFEMRVKGPDGGVQTSYSSTVTMVRPGQETTVLQFLVSEAGEVRRDTFTNAQRRLYREAVQ